MRFLRLGGNSLTVKVLFITSVPFIRQHEIDMYFDTINERFPTEKWDCSKMFSRETYEVSDLACNRICIHSLDEFRKRLQFIVSMNSSVCIITNILISKLEILYSDIKKYNIPIINIDKEGLASWLAYNGLLHDYHGDSIRDRVATIIMSHYYLRVAYRFIRRRKAKYDVVFSGYNYYPENCNAFVKTHNVKYDEYIRAKECENIIGTDYILFLDAALANHPMFANSSRKKMNVEKYIESLNSFFDELEKKWGMPVVISAHPKSKYAATTFHGRDIIKYKTPQLIRHCSFIVSHYSTSLIDAVLQYKPVIVLTSEDLVTSSTRKSVLMGIEFANILNIRIVDLGKLGEYDYIFDKHAYDLFLADHVINMKQINMMNSDFVIQYLNTLETS